jgi:hypothetical protein
MPGAMTSVSRSGDARELPGRANGADSKGFPRAARNLLETRAMLVGLALLAPLTASVVGTGCVVPLPYEAEDSDAGPRNYPPIITAAIPSMPGPHTLDAVQQATPFTIDVKDADLEDTICVRVFRDYDADNALPPLFQRCFTNDPVTGEEERTLELQTTTWCNGGASAEGQHYFQVVVADTVFLDDITATPPYQAISPDSGKDKQQAIWVLICPPETSGT